MIFKPLFKPISEEPPEQNADKTVIAFVDSQSIWDVPIRFYHRKVDYRRLRNFIANGRRLLEWNVSVIVDPLRDSDDFCSLLESLDCKIHLKSFYKFSTDGQMKNYFSSFKSPWTQSIVSSARECRHADIISIVGTDIAYLDLIKEFQEEGREIELICWPEDLDERSRPFATHLRPMDPSLLLNEQKTR